MSSSGVENVPSVRRANRRYHGALWVLAIIVVGFMLTCLILLLAQSTTLANVQKDDAKTSAQIADCTTPKGACYERGKTQTQAAVQQIIDALDQLETQRNVTSGNLTSGQAALRDAVRRLCVAQAINCPTVQ